MIATQTTTAVPTMTAPTSMKQAVIPSAVYTRTLVPSDTERSSYGSERGQVDIILNVPAEDAATITADTSMAAKEPIIKHSLDVFSPIIRNKAASYGHNNNDKSVRGKTVFEIDHKIATFTEEKMTTEPPSSTLADMQMVFRNGYPESGRKIVRAPNSTLDFENGRMLLTGHVTPNIKIVPMRHYVNNDTHGGVYGTDRQDYNKVIRKEQEKAYLDSKYS